MIFGLEFYIDPNHQKGHGRKKKMFFRDANSQKLLPLHLFPSQRRNKIRQEGGIQEIRESLRREVKGIPTAITAVQKVQRTTILDLSGKRKGSRGHLFIPTLQKEKHTEAESM